MTREYIEKSKTVLISFMTRFFKETDAEQGEANALQFENDMNEIFDLAIKRLEQEPTDYKALYENYLKKSSIVIEQLRADRDRLLADIEKIKAEISTVYESLDGYDPNSLGIFESRVTELIDNLLSEQGE